MEVAGLEGTQQAPVRQDVDDQPLVAVGAVGHPTADPLGGPLGERPHDGAVRFAGERGGHGLDSRRPRLGRKRGVGEHQGEGLPPGQGAPQPLGGAPGQGKIAGGPGEHRGRRWCVEGPPGGRATGEHRADDLVGELRRGEQVRGQGGGGEALLVGHDRGGLRRTPEEEQERLLDIGAGGQRTSSTGLPGSSPPVSSARMRRDWVLLRQSSSGTATSKA